MGPFWEPSSSISLGRREQNWGEGGFGAAGVESAYLGRTLKPRQLWAVATLIGVLFIVFGARAYDLQVLQGADYRKQAEGNRLHITTVPAPRGTIYDRYGRIIADNVPRLSVAFIPHDLPSDIAERDKVVRELSALVKVDEAELREAWDTLRAERPDDGAPHLVVPNVPLELGPQLSLRAGSWPGVAIVTAPLRTYPLTVSEAPSLSHVLGYVSAVSEEDLADPASRYSSVDVKGKNGLERTLEDTLKGQNGERRVEVNALGEAQQVVSQTTPIAGQSVWLTLDADAQAVAEKALRKGLERAQATRGVVIAIDPNDGGILALVSLPGFDANLFNRGLTVEEYRTLATDPDRPLFNRATQGVYPSGSTIKPVVASAALSEGLITDQTTFLSTGGLRLGQFYFPDWKAGGHGITDVRKAIAESVNTFFYMIGGGFDTFTGLGIDRLGEYWRRFGLGAPTGIDLPGEADGLVPTPEWKQRVKGERWYIGDTYHASIGQGDLLVTPLQVANYTAAFANGGTLYQPHLLSESDSAQGRTKAQSTVIRRDMVSPQVMQIVRAGMRQTVTDGSARSLAALPISVAGKTGTAEVGGTQRTHAWFIGFAPYEKPNIAVTVLIENGGEGSSYAVPVAGEILKWWAEHRVD